jgi:D-proline reductase (dithiol) PrdB
VGLVCRVVEEAGIATVCLSTGRDLTVQVRPPRALFVNFPMGNAFGKPFDSAMQTAILRDCLAMAETCTTPGALIDLPYAWDRPFAFNPGNANM